MLVPKLSKLWLVISLIAASTATPVRAEETALSGYQALQARQKSICSTLEEGVPRYGMFEGRAYSRITGEEDRLLFGVLGLNVRQCELLQDEERGRGFRSVAREIMLYLDPITNQVIDTWENPWTGKHVAVVHVANDPVNMKVPRFENGAGGEVTEQFRIRLYNDIAASAAEVPLFYDNPLGGDYQKYVGGSYHAMEIFNRFYDAEALLNPEVVQLDQIHLAWSRIAPWLPWMEMGSRPGLMVLNATGTATLDRSTVPVRLARALEERYPDFLEPPPLGDTRPNETSWTVFRDALANAEGDL